jgi:hypothetical protein
VGFCGLGLCGYQTKSGTGLRWGKRIEVEDVAVRLCGGESTRNNGRVRLNQFAR